MTEVEWLACDDPQQLLEFLRGKVSDRKLRLFGVACCRRAWHYLADPRARTALELVERAADGADIPAKLRRAAADLRDVLKRLERRMGGVSCEVDAEYIATAAVQCLFDGGGLAPADHVERIPWRIVSFVREASTSLYRERDERDECLALCAVLRDVVGNPFRLVNPDPSHLTPTVLGLARAAYADRAFDRLPVLADALQDAGCDDTDILEHLRGPGPHVRGCWTLDGVVGYR